MGDKDALTQHISLLAGDRELLARLRQAGLAKVPEMIWSAAGRNLLQVYRETIGSYAAAGRQAERAASPAPFSQTELRHRTMYSGYIRLAAPMAHRTSGLSSI